MTDGIIQKAFKKEIEYWQRALVSDDYSSNREIYSFEIKNLQRLEQELIKEIKNIENTVPNKWQLMIKLIGDNE